MGQESDEIVECPVEKIVELRRLFFERLDRDGHKIQGGFHPADIDRVRNRNKWLQSFLEYNDLDTKASLDQLWESCVFRKANNNNDTNETTIDLELIKQGMVFPRNKDVDGHRLLIFKSKLYIRGANNMDNMKRNLIYYVERLYRETDMDRISVVFDMYDTGMSNMDLEYTRYIINLFKLYYPNSLNYIIIYELPWILNATFKIIKSLLPPKAVSRMKFVNRKTIREFIDEDNLLSCWGGKDDYKYEFTPQDPNARILERDEDDDADEKNNNHSAVNNKNTMSNGIAGKKVHFANNMSPLESPMSETAPTFKTEDKRLKILEDGIVFVSKNNDIQGVVIIKNICEETVAFKVKTTSPEKFRVSPPVGLIRSGQTEKITITLVQGYELGSNRDKFLIMCKPLEEGQTEDTLTIERIHKDFKVAVDSIEHHRVRCIYPPPSSELFATGAPSVYGESPKGGGGNSSFTDSADDRHGRSSSMGADRQLAARSASQISGLTDQVHRLERQVRFSQILQYISIVLFFLLSLAVVYLLKMEMRENSAQYCTTSTSGGFEPTNPAGVSQ